MYRSEWSTYQNDNNHDIAIQLDDAFPQSLQAHVSLWYGHLPGAHLRYSFSLPSSSGWDAFVLHWHLSTVPPTTPNPKT